MDKFSSDINWNQVKTKIQTQPWASATEEALRQGFDAFTKEWRQNPPTGRTQRFHGYFCKVCASRLMPDLQKPHEHICLDCGAVYAGDPFDGTWQALVHAAIAANLERASVLANLYPEEKRYGEYVRQICLFYADHYGQYEAPDAQNGQGKVMPHVLNEAIFVIHMGRIMELVGKLELFDASELFRIGEGFFRPAAEFIRPKLVAIHNHDVWKGGAVAAAADFLQDKALLAEVIDGEFGWINQVDKGVTDDGIWYEISPNYHFYTLAALVRTAQIAKSNGRDLYGNQKFRKMFSQIISLAYENGELPAYNDCWYGYKLDRYVGVYEQLSGIYPETAQALAVIYQNSKPAPCVHMSEMGNIRPTCKTAFARNSMAALLYGVAALPDAGKYKKGSRALLATGIGILENDGLRVDLKATDGCGWHDHADMLSIGVYAGGEQIAADIGTSGYGIARTDLWNKSGAAHNMVIVGGQRQMACHAQLTFTDHILTAVCNGAYPGVVLKRTLALEKQGFSDTFEVDCQKTEVIDWLFHCKGKLLGVYAKDTQVELKNTPDFQEGNGYSQIIGLTEVRLDGDWNMAWQTALGVLTLYVEGIKNTTVLVGRCYGPVGIAQDMPIVIIRREVKKTVFRCRFEYR